MLSKNKNGTVNLLVERNGNEIQLPVDVDENGQLGFGYKPTDNYKWEHLEYNIVESIIVGNRKAWDMLLVNINAFGKMVTGKISAKSLSGPSGIAKAFGCEWIWQRFWVLVGLLSMVLAFINILPIPALDGGHTIFLSIEAISGKKFSDDFMTKAQVAGMVILGAFMIFVIGNDIWKLF